MKKVLITGGSSGIGLELSKQFGQTGRSLVLVSKPLGELEQAQRDLKVLFPEIEVDIIQKDLTGVSAPEEVYEMVQNKGWIIDVLVNNAGIGTFGFMNEIEMEKEVSMIQLNIVATYKLTRLFLTGMVERNEGKILNLSSISAFQPNPKLTTYGATKSFVLNFSRALNYELKEKGSKVRVATVCPTPVNTGFQQSADMHNSKLFDSWMKVTAETVAKDGYTALMRDQDMVVPNRAFHWLNKISKRLPTGFLMKFASKSLEEG